MIRSTVRRAFLSSCWGIVLFLMLVAPRPARAEADEPESLARYIPAEGLSALIEHEGLSSHGDAWKATAAYKMLNETSLGAMLEDLAVQVANRAIQASPGAPLSGKELIALLRHLIEEGFALGLTADPQQPGHGFRVVVIRDAADNDVFRRILQRIPPLNPPATQQVDGPGGRKIWSAPGTPIRWWFEKKDFVLCFSAEPGTNPAVDALEGKIPSALKNATYSSLGKLEAGSVPIGRFFVDLSALPPLPPRAAELGLDGVRRIEGRWGIRDKGCVVTLGVEAPRPRRGMLAMFDQPAIAPGTSVVTPQSSDDYTILSIDPAKLAHEIVSMVQKQDPQAAERLVDFGRRFRDHTGLSLRDDLLAKIGPRMLVLPSGANLGSAITFWLHPPDIALVAELKDVKDFSTTLDRLMEAANTELKAAGGMVRPQPGQPVRPGTAYAEFRRLKPPEQGYVLAVPPSVFPTPAGLRPTILVEPASQVLILAGSPATARRAKSALLLKAAGPAPPWERDAVVFSQNDPASLLPELLVSLPSIIQFIGFAATQQPGPRPPGQNQFRLEIDPDAIPEAGQLRPYFFPSRFSIAVNDDSIRLSSYQAFPVPLPSLDVGMEAPVLIALLLPAVQSAREAARRAQCVNNLKQIALATHNYISVTENFPPVAIKSPGGKPLLSWRVALLPYLEQKPLYDKFKLDEPWDSPHNKELIKFMPPLYACPSRNVGGETGMTAYRVFQGRKTIFDPDHATRLADVTDGTSNTILVVEAKEPVIWTKPDEIPFDLEPADAFKAGQTQPLLGAGSMHPGGLNAAFADGSVRFLKTSINKITLYSLITRAGGEVVSSDSY
jgi:prepilin-type processing-associated H-X9-DG protein